MPDTPDKSNDNLNVRCPDMLKTRFNRLATAKGTNMSALIVEYIESYVEKEEQYLDAIADIFGYARTAIKERRANTGQNDALRIVDKT